MAAPVTASEIIASALSLPIAERTEVLIAIENSLVDAALDHGPEEPADEVEAAWADEIARRLDDIDSGRVKTIPSEEAWKIINGEAPPTF